MYSPLIITHRSRAVVLLKTSSREDSRVIQHTTVLRFIEISLLHDKVDP